MENIAYNEKKNKNYTPNWRKFSGILLPLLLWPTQSTAEYEEEAVQLPRVGQQSTVYLARVRTGDYGFLDLAQMWNQW